MLAGIIHIAGALALAFLPAAALLLASINLADRAGLFWRYIHLLIIGHLAAWLLLAALLAWVAR